MSINTVDTANQLLAENAKLNAEVARLNEQVRALAALAEERREFIVNGVELGYIQTPTAPLDKATGTYERCLLKPKFAADAILNEVRAQAVEGFEKYCIHLAECSGDKRWIGCGRNAAFYANSIRAGEVQL